MTPEQVYWLFLGLQMVIAFAIWTAMTGAVRWAKGLHKKPCCAACKGTGYSGDPETNGLCWDCRGTGHPHELKWPNQEA